MNNKKKIKPREIPKCIKCRETGKKWYQPFPCKDGKRFVDYCCDCLDESYRTVYDSGSKEIGKYPPSFRIF